MAQGEREDITSQNEPIFHFLSEQRLEQLETADANPFVKISQPDRSIPFIILSDGGVVADITANNPKTIFISEFGISISD